MSQCLVLNIFKLENIGVGWERISAVECLPVRHKALGLIGSTTRREKKTDADILVGKQADSRVVTVSRDLWVLNAFID